MAFNKKTIKDIDIKGKKVLLRADFNVPLAEDGSVANDYRIRMALPTIKYLLDNGARQVGILSHLGRPEGRIDMKYSLEGVAGRLAELLGQPVEFVNDCLHRPDTDAKVVLFENVRFYEQEEENEIVFSKDLTERFDLFVEDGFGVVHRDQASVTGVTEFLPSVAGYLVEREVDVITDALEKPDQPFVAVLGGAKIADKIDLINNLMDKGVKKFIIAGAMANTFLAMNGYNIGASKYDADSLDEARNIQEKLESRGIELILPDIDAAVAKSVDESQPRREVKLGDVAPDDMILDIGQQSIDKLVGALDGAKTIIWNGTFGVTELPNFSHGSEEFAVALAKMLEAKTIIGGGDTAGFIDEINMLGRFTHVSTGGGASLELMAGKKLPGVEALLDK